MRRVLRRARDGGPSQLSLWSQDPAAQQWRVRVSERTRRMTIRVCAGGGVEIVVPRGARAGSVQRFVHQHRGWIEQKVRELSFQLPQAALPERITLRALEESWAVHYRTGRGRPRLFRTGTHALEVAGDTSREDDVRNLLQHWLIDQARRGLAPWLERTALESGLAFERVQIRRQRTRWGSCSPRGTISLNCCLLFQDPPVVRYLLLHELCHTRHMNHSNRFWRLVGEYEPAYRRLDRELVNGWRHVPGWVLGS